MTDFHPIAAQNEKEAFSLPFFSIILVTVNIVLPFPQTSYELQSGFIAADPAPYAPTAEKRVWLWLRKYAPVIHNAAYKYHVDPLAIAGVIAWEGSQNNHIKHMTYARMINFIFTKGLFLKSIGPGKVQAWGPNNAAAFLEGNTRYQPVFPPLPHSYLPDVMQRIIRLYDPEFSIEYIAGIMNAYASEAEKAGYTGSECGLRTHPEVLATFFDGVSAYSLPHAAAAFRQRMKTQGKICFKVNGMGKWILENKNFLSSAFALPPNGRRNCGASSTGPIDAGELPISPCADRRSFP